MNMADATLTDRPTYELIGKILRRAREDLCLDIADPISLEMDLAACHNLGHVNLTRLLETDLASFAHDLGGIVRHLDRNTGELTECFIPRCCDN